MRARINQRYERGSAMLADITLLTIGYYRTESSSISLSHPTKGGGGEGKYFEAFYKLVRSNIFLECMGA